MKSFNLLLLLILLTSCSFISKDNIFLKKELSSLKNVTSISQLDPLFKKHAYATVFDGKSSYLLFIKSKTNKKRQNVSTSKIVIASSRVGKNKWDTVTSSNDYIKSVICDEIVPSESIIFYYFKNKNLKEGYVTPSKSWKFDLKTKKFTLREQSLNLACKYERLGD